MHRWRRLIRETYRIHPTFYGAWNVTQVLNAVNDRNEQWINSKMLQPVQSYELLVQSPWGMRAAGNVCCNAGDDIQGYNEEWAAKHRPEQVVSLSWLRVKVCRVTPLQAPVLNMAMASKLFIDPVHIWSAWSIHSPSCRRSHQQRMRETPSMPQLIPYKHGDIVDNIFDPLDNEGSLFLINRKFHQITW